MQVSFHFTVTLLPLGRRSSRYLALARPSWGGRYGSLRTYRSAVPPRLSTRGTTAAAHCDDGEHQRVLRRDVRDDRALNTADRTRTGARAASDPRRAGHASAVAEKSLRSIGKDG